MRIKDAVKYKHIEPEYYETLAQVESSGNPNAEAATSSAAGLYQFTEATWKGLTEQMGLDYTLQDRFDPEKSRRVVEEFTKRNNSYLKRVIGSEPTSSELYLAHFLGAPKAGDFLSTAYTTPNVPVTEVLPESYLSANESVFYNKKGNPKTVREVYNWAASKFSSPELNVEGPVYALDNNGNPIVVNPNFATEYEKKNSETVKELLYNQSLTNYDNPQKSGTFAEQNTKTNTSKKEKTKEGTSEEKKVDSWKQKLQQKINERKFLIDFINQGGIDYVAPQRQPVNAAQRIQQSYMQDGGIAEEKQWIDNWYKNRQVENKYINEAIQLDKPYFDKRASNIPEIQKVENIKPNVEAQYSNDTIKLTPRATTVDKLHEYDHYITDQPLYSRTTDKAVISRNILPKEKTKGVYREKYEYFTDPSEVKARINNLRKEAGFEPDKPVEKEELINFLQKKYKGDNSNINDLYYITPNVDSLLDILNNTAFINSDNNNFYAQNGGQIPTSPNGLYDYPDAEQVLVPVTNGRITMKNITTPVLGISQETGQQILMYPDKEYFFPETKTVLEIPQR